MKDKTNLSAMAELRDRLIAVHSDNLTEANNLQRAQETRDAALKTLHPLVKQARTSLKGLVEDVPGAKALPALLPANSEPQKYLQAANDIAEVWAKVNASDAEPVTIPILVGQETVQVTQAAFVAAVVAFSSAVDTLMTARSAEALGRKTRDSLHKIAKAKLIAYPAAAKARLADGDPLRATIPTFSNG
ncbi:hypothetical protein [Armatimonas sp.]|uniref:hypothetical protein n=1 Tax=Armatimonas sp. TaxID=1872638 RepID=UPI00286B4B5E|nr:hypothetical protein [Armatimonas sp.]